MAWGNYFFHWMSAHIEDNEEGQGLVEYGLIISLIAVVCVVALIALGGGVRDTLNSIVGNLGGSTEGGGGGE